MDIYLIALLIVLAAAALLLIAYIFMYQRKKAYLAAIYAAPIRDYRFASAILKLYFGKAVIKSPYVLKTLAGVPPKADVLLILRGGIVIVTVSDKKGFYSTPQEGEWSVTTDSGLQRLPNLQKGAEIYISALESCFMKSGIECPAIYSVTLLSDDFAGFDELYPENILTGKTLVTFCKKISHIPLLSAKKRQIIRQAVIRNHRACKTYIEKTPDGRANGEADDKSE